ncbi:conserved hypothetical protein [Vibrio nigripulchritudo SOn1]|uniref:Uncharacterized protein n=1 Tax=Vibrio nigripulchritudo SOn1 TaxID=1238450 RepID=A0AAV2VHV4_9VIBR|nr:hypothetical protein [Vibrio nigripulchritudo]CCO44121.1 conserved hypothetical protein [Vibrio nigripulchritudo SOn1]
MTMKKNLLVAALAACGVNAAHANGTDLYVGAYQVSTAMEESIDEMLTAKLKASFFSSAALYMDVLNVAKHSASPGELKSQLEKAYKDPKYTDEQRQELADASNEVGMVIDYLKSNGNTKGIESQKMTFCSADDVDATNWPGIDDVKNQFGTQNGITNVLVSTIYMPDENDNCAPTSDWASKLRKGATKADFQSIPFELIAYSDNVGNTGGELVYILENDIEEEVGFEEKFESFTFYQSSSDDTPSEGVFRRYRATVPTVLTKDAYYYSSNISCQECNGVNEKFKVESRYESDYAGQGNRDGVIDNAFVAATATEDSAGNLIPGFIDESLSDAYLVDATLNFSSAGNSTLRVVVDKFDLEKELVVGRYDSQLSAPHLATSGSLKFLNLVGQFGIKEDMEEQGVDVNSESLAVKGAISPNQFTITDGKTDFQYTATDVDELEALKNIIALTPSSISYNERSVDVTIWNGVK